MHSLGRIVALGALLSAVVAVPMKRELIINTVTEVEVVTEIMTATVWVDATDAPVPYHAAHFTQGSYEHHTSVAWVETSHAVPTTSSSVYVAAPASTSTSSSSTSSTSVPQVTAPAYTAPPQPTITTTSSVYVAPPAPTTTSSSVYVAPAPVYTPPTTTAAPAQTTTTSSSGSTHTGEITYYDVGLGSCGITNTNSEMVVAMAIGLMDKATMCGKTITISYQGKSHQATVVDTCPGCKDGSLDLSPSLFNFFASPDAGRVAGATWSFN